MLRRIIRSLKTSWAQFKVRNSTSSAKKLGLTELVSSSTLLYFCLTLTLLRACCSFSSDQFVSSRSQTSTPQFHVPPFFFLIFFSIILKLSVLDKGMASRCMKKSVEKKLQENFIIRRLIQSLYGKVYATTEKQMPFIGISVFMELRPSFEPDIIKNRAQKSAKMLQHSLTGERVL